MKKKLLSAIILFYLVPCFGYTDQTTTERIIKENKLFVEFLNICLSNFSDKDSEKLDTFYNVYQSHFNGEVAFLQSDYHRAFKDVYKSQDANVHLYNKVLNEYYLDESKIVLDRLAPGIIKSKNSAARQYLTLGYRDRALARNVQMVGNASRPHLRSHKIYAFMEAIKYSRRSMRYALLALFESQDIETKKLIYNHLFEIERENNNPFYNRFLSKDDKALVAEINRDYEDYENEYGPKLEAELKRYEETGKIPDRTGGSASGTELDSDPAGGGVSVTPGNPEAVDYLYENKIERRLRFRQEQRVANYVRNGEFYIANEVIVKYVNDFNFKLIAATIEVMRAREDKVKYKLDYDKLYIQHLDNYSRLARESVLDSFADRVRVVDDITREGGEKKDAKDPVLSDDPDA
ncbi:MAG: hypothetical protein JXK07_03050 [Spirochaetes bacterium]|nr:hypothetical protein [Spirochaetota bacterium]MBN2771064.1 hypothetical protein [Spirochaetota bacterium]